MIQVFYSAEDEGYIAIDTDLPLISVFGETEADAIRELETVAMLICESIL